ncbi:hypothetical protein ACP70R_009930 [Stipagrostis hirtigluma subsp. patula]
MSEMGDALRSCMEQLFLLREEKERIIIEATKTISSGQKKTRDLQQKFEDASKRFDNVMAENYNLRNTVDSKEELIKELKESKAHLDQKLNEATARLEFSQKHCASLQYEVRMLQNELEIRNKEREYDLKSIDAAQKQQQESMKKITALEAECQKLRTMVQKRLPGPSAFAKMKDEVKQQGISFVDSGRRRPRKAVRPKLDVEHSVSEGCLVKLQELGDENRHLRQLLTKEESDLQFLKLKSVDEACKLSVLQRQLEKLSGHHDLTENNHSEPMISAFSSKLEHSGSGQQRVYQSRQRRVTGSDMQLLIDPLEVEKLEMPSRPSSAPHQSVPDVSDTDSKMVISETVHGDLKPDDGFSGKHPEWIQDVLKVIIHMHQVSNISFSGILDKVTHALRSEISAKGNGSANLFYDRLEIDKMVATLMERVRRMIERSTENNIMTFRSLILEKSELTLRFEHLIHVCNDVLDGKANLERFFHEICLILEWIVNQCFSYLEGLDTVDHITNISDGNESPGTLSTHEKDAMQSAKSEMVLAIQEVANESVETTESQVPDEISENSTQIQLTTSKLDEELFAVRQELANSCQENHSLYCQAESSASDGTREQLAEESGKELITTSAISASAKKLAECQETIANLSKQFDALQNPANADALDKEKLETPVENLAEAYTKPEDFSSSTAEDTACMKHTEADATEKNLEHEQDSGAGPNAANSGSTLTVVRPTGPKSPRTSIPVDAKKKKRRASLLSRLVFRKKA